MELVSGYRDRLIAFSETMAQWYFSFQTCPKLHREKEGGLSDTWGHGPPRYPIDNTSPLWILHLLDCTAPPPTVHSRLNESDIDPADLGR